MVRLYFRNSRFQAIKANKTGNKLLKKNMTGTLKHHRISRNEQGTITFTDTRPARSHKCMRTNTGTDAHRHKPRTSTRPCRARTLALARHQRTHALAQPLARHQHVRALAQPSQMDRNRNQHGIANREEKGDSTGNLPTPPQPPTSPAAATPPNTRRRSLPPGRLDLAAKQTGAA